MKIIRMAVLLGAALAMPLPGVAAGQSKVDNILLIIADDLNDWIGPIGGHPQAKTPNLDKLAARGVTFMNAQCPAPLCNPSRTAFMSGKRPSTTGIYDNQQLWMPRIGRGLCINDYVRQFGMKSYGAGKIYHYRNFRAEDWDEVFYVTDDTLPGTVAERRPGPFGYRMFTDGKPEAKFDEQRKESELVDARSVSWCVDKLGAITNRFLMVCGIHRPHTPWDVPKKYFDLYPVETIQLPKVLTNDLADVPPQGIEFANPKGVHAEILRQGLWKDRVHGYLAAISYMDAQVGRLLDALDKSKYGSRTAVVFVGDNGWHLGEKEHWAKVTLWGEASRVPLIWAVPGFTRSSKCYQGVDLMSVYPTACELAGIPVPSHQEGTSILPLLQNPAQSWSRPALTTMYKQNHVLCTDQWRYIHYADGTEELYDIKKDPNEWTNLAGASEYKDVKKKLAAYLPAKDADPVDHQPGKKKGKKKRNAAVAP